MQPQLTACIWAKVSSVTLPVGVPTPYLPHTLNASYTFHQFFRLVSMPAGTLGATAARSAAESASLAPNAGEAYQSSRRAS